MRFKLSGCLFLHLAAVTLASSSAFAQFAGGVIKVGVLSDFSGLYADAGGVGELTAARLAIEDFAAVSKGMKVEIITGDHQNKADVGAAIAGSWLDVGGVDVIVGGGNSAVALAVSEVVRERNKVLLASDAATSDLTGPQCSPNTIHWTYDTWMLANSTGGAVVKAGGKTWFFLTADYSFGHALERDTSRVVEANGGKVIGGVRHPINTSDFSSFLLQAQASKAQVIGLANTGADATNAIKQAAEFGIVKNSKRLVSLLLFATDVAALGLPIAQGLQLTETWYWDLNGASRAWTKRWQIERPGKIPTMSMAGVYSSLIHYLKAVEALNSDSDGKAVVAKMKEMPTDDPLFGRGMIRIDGRKIHDAYLFEVKKPEESKYFGDLYKLLSTIEAADAFRPLNEGGCSLVSP
jgi:branched-chain amino acid transport system substrate-binding protein